MCPNLTSSRYCNEHKKEKYSYDRYRGSSHERGYDHRWRQARLAFLMKHPFCVDCLEDGRHELANVVDHIIPHKGDKELFWDESNWQPLCKRHHDQKTITTDMGSW